MLDTKIIQTTIDLFVAKDIYSSNKEVMLMEKLDKKYKNICYQSILITKILRVINYSPTKMVDDRLDGSAYIDVKFEVEGIILLKGEIIPDCKVINKTTQNLIIESKYADGMVSHDLKKSLFRLIDVGQSIPVMVLAKSYNPNQKKITILSTPFYPQSSTNIIYNIIEPLTFDQVNSLTEIINKLEKEMELHDVKKKSYEFFKKIAYPFKVTQKFGISKLGTKFKPLELSIKKLMEIKDGFIIAPMEEYHENNLQLFHSRSTEAFAMRSTMYQAISEIISKRTLYMYNLRMLSEQYDTPEKISSLMTYWTTCAIYKE